MPSCDSGNRLGGKGRLRHLQPALLAVLVTAILAAAAAPHFADLGRTATLVAPGDPAVRLDGEITAEFGMANPVVWGLEARRGTVWTSELLARLQALTREVFKIPGVIPMDVISLASPNLRDLEVTATGFRPVYLMGRVPHTPAALDALRRRVEGDPNYRGNLVSLDGRAAMVVANFRGDADARDVGSAARTLRDKYTDAAARVYVTGALVLATLPARTAWPAAVAVLAVLATGLTVSVFALGRRASAAMGLAGLLAALWAAFALTALDLAVLPWSLFPLPAVALAGAAMTVPEERQGLRTHPWKLACGLCAGFATLALGTDEPARALGIAGAVGALTAPLAGRLLRLRSGRVETAPPAGRWSRAAVLVLIVVSAFGVARLRSSLGMAGYGQRYLIGPAASDLRAFARRFPPPSIIALRARGPAGFVSSPGVLHALDAVLRGAREDPAVVSAMSLADLVKLVHRAFNENRAGFFAIPEDRGLISRYLTLAYSPGFRRFVNRGLSSTAAWIYVRGDNAADLTRIVHRAQARLAAHPIPEANVDFPGRDGAVVLAMDRTVRALALWAVVGGLICVVSLAFFAGPATGLRALTGAVAGCVTATGALGWLDVPIDLVTLPLLIAAGAATIACSALGKAAPGAIGRLGLVATTMALPALVIPHAAAHAGASFLLAVAVAALLCGGPFMTSPGSCRTV